MANYSINQCLEIKTIPAEVKTWLTQLSISKLPTVKDRVFTAQNQTALVQLLNEEFEKYKKAKEKRNSKKSKKDECFKIIRTLIGTKGTPQIISPKELLPRLQALKDSIEQEKKFVKVDKALEATGMTVSQLIEYLQKK